MPEFIFSTLDAIPEEMRATAKKNEAGSFVLNLVDKVKVDEFRDTNIKVSKERDDLKKFVDAVKPIIGEDPTKFSEDLKSLRDISQKVSDGKLKATDDVEKVLAERTANMKSTYESQAQERAKEVAVLKNENNSLKGELKKINIDRVVTAAVLDERSGALPEALPMILSQAYDIFVVEDDNTVVPKKGDAVIYGSDGATPMSPFEWLTGKLREKHSFLFKNSAGGGAGGGSNKDFGGMSKADFDKLPASKKLEIANKIKR